MLSIWALQVNFNSVQTPGKMKPKTNSTWTGSRRYHRAFGMLWCCVTNLSTYGWKTVPYYYTCRILQTWYVFSMTLVTHSIEKIYKYDYVHSNLKPFSLLLSITTTIFFGAHLQIGSLHIPRHGRSVVEWNIDRIKRYPQFWGRTVVEKIPRLA